MAPKKSKDAPPSAPQAPADTKPEPMYPNIEAFIETASSADIEGLYAPLKDSLGALKGPRAEIGKKAVKAVDRAQELLLHLLEVREKIEAEREASSKAK
jgi:hypothetical protein